MIRSLSVPYLNLLRGRFIRISADISSFTDKHCLNRKNSKEKHEIHGFKAAQLKNKVFAFKGEKVQ